MLTIRASGVKINQIQGGSLPLKDIFTHKELFQSGISKGLKGKNVCFVSQLMSSDGTCLLRYKDLKHRIKINTQGKIPGWFKTIEKKLIDKPLISKKVKSIYQLGHNLIENNVDSEEFKSRNWIATFNDQVNTSIIGHIIDKPDNGKFVIEYWIQKIENDTISPLLQLPIIKKCRGCEIKTDRTRNRRNNSNMRCITKAAIDNSVKINASFIQNDHYIIDNSIYEVLAQVKCKHYGGPNVKVNDVERVNGLLRIKDNPSSNKAELMAVILSVMVCPKVAEIKAHGDNENNKTIDKLAKLGIEKETLIVEDTLLLHNETICWRDMPIERNPILTIKGVKDAQFVDEFMLLNRSLIYQQPELLELINWKMSLKLNCINQYDTLFEDHYLQSFRIKICCDELPTCANLKKRKPELYDNRWKCNFCGIEEETYDHLWQCYKIKDIVQEIISIFKKFLVNIIIEFSKDEINKDQLVDKVEELAMWDFNCHYNFTFLLKNQISYKMMNLFKFYKIVDPKRIHELIKQIIRKIILDFKILIWEYRNEIQLEKEKRYNIISNKDKKKKSKSKSNSKKDNGKHIIIEQSETNWNKWNDLAFHWDGHWANF
ncbi:hypothetical protein RhiirC2_870830 [Rhizophagus irregularis]|uniref:RNase H type-1 domain-containing protein n=1 Tax=Rhizophagus irregularis TaxID=588596 RepID=A0A2N1MGS2_9GLOM|nr:hypothetical protein RhiirC2_870830 [Rhizophagus irregularis]